MSYIIVSNNLNVINDPVTIQIYNSVGLNYTQILSVSGINDYSISSDKLTLTVNPSQNVGEVPITLQISGSSSIGVPLYFGTEYEKDTKDFPDSQLLYTENMFNWDETNPKTYFLKAYDSMINDIYKIFDGEKKIPLIGYFNDTFPEYVSCQLIGTAFALAVQQYYEVLEADRPDLNYVVVNNDLGEPDPAPTDVADMILTGEAIDSPDSDGKYHLITSDLNNKIYALKNGAIDSQTAGKVDYTGRYRATEIAANYEGSERFILQNWTKCPAFPASIEILYRKESYDMAEFAGQEIVIPSKKRVLFDDYTPVAWLSKALSDIKAIAVKYDGINFYIKLNVPPCVFTWDTDEFCKLIDYGTWGA